LIDFTEPENCFPIARIKSGRVFSSLWGALQQLFYRQKVRNVEQSKKGLVS